MPICISTLNWIEIPMFRSLKKNLNRSKKSMDSAATFFSIIILFLFLKKNLFPSMEMKSLILLEAISLTKYFS